jgi:hypothetical protein
MQATTLSAGSQGMQENQQVAFMSGGGENARRMQAYVHPSEASNENDPSPLRASLQASPCEAEGVATVNTVDSCA